MVSAPPAPEPPADTQGPEIEVLEPARGLATPDGTVRLVARVRDAIVLKRKNPVLNRGARLPVFADETGVVMARVLDGQLAFVCRNDPVPSAGTVIGLAAPSIQRELDEAAEQNAESEADSGAADA